MKTIFALLLLTACLALAGPVPPAPAAPNPTAPAGEEETAAVAPPGVQVPAAGQAIPAQGSPRVVGGAAPPAALPAPGLLPIPNPGAPPADGTSPSVPALTPNVAAPAPGGPAAKPAEEEVIMAGGINLTGADLTTVLIKYAEMVGRSVLRSPTLPQPNFFFMNQTPLTKTEAIQAYQAMFAMNGVTLIEVGDKFLKALPAAESITAGQHPLIITNASQLPELGQYVTYIYQLKSVKTAEAMQMLTPFQKMANAIMPVEASQMLVIRDFTENVKRMLELLEKVDIPGQAEFETRVIPIKFAKAEDIASALSSLSGSGSSTTVGTRPAGGTSAPSGLGARPGMGGYQQGGFGQQNQPGGLGSNPTGTPSQGGSFSDRINQIINRAAKTSGSADFQIIGPNKIVADVRSNSLMVFASHADMNTITNIISQLDIVLSQVVIESIILDVSLSDTFSFGVSGIQTKKDFGSTFSGAGGMNANQLFDFSNATQTNASGQLLGSGLRYFGKVNDDIYLQIEAMAAAGRLNVIQKPRVQTSHATPASIFIGSTVPYVSSTYYGGGYGGYPSSSYQQLSVGISLNVTPFINQDGLVVMKLDETIDEISDYTKIDGNEVPNTTHRTVSAEVAVLDRETIMVGGFIRNAENKSKAGVPYLKDIPLLGALFASNDSNKSRKELLILMRPTVLKTPSLAAMHVAEEKAGMPGIRAAEASAAKEVQELNGKSARKPANKGTPFTPEETKLYGNPQSTPATTPPNETP